MRVHRMQRLVMIAALAAASTAAAEDRARVTLSKPAEKQQDCVGQKMRLPPEVQQRLPKEVDVWFTVDESGAVRDVRTGKHVSLPLATQIRGALSRCSFTPAADARGVPMAVSVRMPIRFALPRQVTAIFSQELARVEPGPLQVVALSAR